MSAPTKTGTSSNTDVGQGIPASIFILNACEKVERLARLIYEETAQQEGGVITTMRTWLKAVSLAIDVAAKHPCWSEKDIEVLNKAKSLLERSLDMVMRKMDTRFGNAEQWIKRKLNYIVRDLKWIIRKIESVAAIPPDERDHGFCVTLTE
jgi:hypothetical protein